MSFVERIKLTDGTEVASINTSNQLEVAAGLGFASVQTEDTASAGGETGTMILAVRNDSGTTKTSADGDFSAIAVDAAGRVGIADLGGSITVDNTGLTALSDSIYADSFSGPSKGIVVAGVYDDGVNDPVTKFLQTNSGGKLLSVIEDGGNTITVDGTVAATQSGTWILGANSGVDIGDVTINNASIAVTGTFWQATQPVSIASAVPVTDNSGSLTVDAPVGTPVFVRLSDGTSAISTLPVSLASVPSHPVTNAGTFAVQVDGAALTSLQLIDDTIATAASAALTKLSQVGGTDGTNARILSTNTSGHLNIADGGNSITVDGTFWQATQPVSIAAAVAVTDNSGSLTVDAPVGTPVFVRLSDGASAISTLPVSLASVPSHPVTNAGTFAVQVDGAALTSLQLLDDTVATAGSAALTKLNQVGGTDGTNARILSTNASGHVNIADGNNSITVDAPVATPVFVRLSDGASAISTLPVSLATVPSHPVTNAGTFAVQVDGAALTALQLLDDTVATAGSAALTKLYQVGGTDGTNARVLSTNTSGHVNIADGGNIITVDGTVSITANSSVNMAQIGGTNTVNGGTAGTIAVGGIQAHDAAISGNNPILCGSYYAVTPADVASGDVTRTWASPKGALLTGAKYEASPPSFFGDTVYHLTLAQDGRLRVDVDFTGKTIATGGNVAHDIADTGNPIKIGAKAIAHGTNPTAVADADRTNLYANRHGILWTIGGHPNLQSAEYITTAAQTSGGDNVLPLISAGTRYVITGVTVTASAANTVNTSVRLGFGTTGVPTQGASAADAVTKVILSHPGIAPGSGVSKGHSGGIVGIGGDGEELYIVCSVPTGGSVVVQVDYYTIES